MGFDLSTLNPLNTIPNDVYAQPTSTYYWLVCNKEIAITQLGTEIPLVPFVTDGISTEETYVKGFQDNKYWIRIRISEIYEEAVNFQIKIK